MLQPFETLDPSNKQKNKKQNVEQIKNIKSLKKGMTNRSFLFEINQDKYIMRIPGEGTDQLINRKEEYEVYQVIKDLNISDEVIYMNPQNGYKITKYLNDTRVCNQDDQEDLRKCMQLLKYFHQQDLKVDHEFNVFEKIDFYEKLRGPKSLYKDYDQTKEKVFSLKNIIEKMPKEWRLCHIDANCDNFLFYKENEEEKIKLIDWEYAAMQDIHLDIAMFCIYSMYNRQQVDNLIDIYFENKCDPVGIQTQDLQNRNLTLYSAKLRDLYVRLLFSKQMQRYKISFNSATNLRLFFFFVESFSLPHLSNNLTVVSNYWTIHTIRFLF